MKRFFAVTIAVLSLSVFSCVKRDVPVQFDTSDPLALNPEIQWAVVTEPYVACYLDADYATAVLTHFRKGEILQVIGERTVKSGGETEKWYAFKDGWLPESTIAVYANKMRAQTAVKQLGVK